jgi:outer membrane protein OmpA-like peptidoglycan-associated protein
MADRIGKCTNYSSCKLAYRNESIAVSGEFICPECKQPLQEIAVEKKPIRVPKQALIFGAAGVAFLLLVGVFVGQCGRKKAPAIAEEPAPAATPGMRSASEPVPTPPPTAGVPPPVQEDDFVFGTPTPLPTPALATPEPPPAAPEETITVAPPAQIQTDPGVAVNKETRDQVLKRIEAKRDLSEEERNRLYALVERARGFGQLITIGFQSGRTTLASAEVDLLRDVLGDPKVRKFTDDPTAVIVILGFADKRGNEQANLKISQARADTVMKVLRDECGVGNLMHSVAMGVTSVFETDDLDQNRVVEAWVVQP